MLSKTYLLICVCVCICFITMCYLCKSKFDFMHSHGKVCRRCIDFGGNGHYFMSSEQSVSRLMIETLEQLGYKKSPHDINHNLICDSFIDGQWFPPNYTFVEQYLNYVPHSILGKKFIIYAIPMSDTLACKKSLAILCNHIDPDHLFSPASFTIEDLQKIEKTSGSQQASNIQALILKKNIQAQRGLLIITADVQSQNENVFGKAYDIMNRYPTFVIAQEVLNDAMRIKERKINIRVYLIIEMQHTDKSCVCKAYTFNDGFVYYTQGNDHTNINVHNIVTTGYTDRNVYDNRPLTLQDLYAYLTKSQVTTLQNSVYNSLNKLLQYWWTKFGLEAFSKIDSQGKYVQWFGVDFHVQETTANAYIIEINKSPSLAPHDSGRDCELKRNFIKSLFQLAKQGDQFNFQKVYDSCVFI